MPYRDAEEQKAYKNLRCRYSRVDRRRLSQDGCEAYGLPLAGSHQAPARFEDWVGPPGDVVEDPHLTGPEMVAKLQFIISAAF